MNLIQITIIYYFWQESHERNGYNPYNQQKESQVQYSVNLKNMNDLCFVSKENHFSITVIQVYPSLI